MVQASDYFIIISKSKLDKLFLIKMLAFVRMLLGFFLVLDTAVPN